MCMKSLPAVQSSLYFENTAQDSYKEWPGADSPEAALILGASASAQLFSCLATLSVLCPFFWMKNVNEGMNKQY